ncbi:MAG: hypothetical protein PHE77_02950, partial [Candidatus Pacebacteria bacterium]|nr:hypothetical protein [Candidatus Paceibacterota bacterium]
MRIYKKILTGLAIALVAATGVILVYSHTNQQVKAGALDNVWGFAWSDLMGWVSFNNTSSGGGNSYGVNITDNGATGVFSGYAWSEHAGWITFNEADLGSCPTAPCRAWVDKSDGLVYGWGKILTTGDWVRLRGNGCNVSIDRNTGDFSGWAWGGETTGWLSFNAVNDSCPYPYKVQTSFKFNTKPTVSISSNPSLVNECTNPAYSFSWTFSDPDIGDTQSAYQVQVVKTSNATWVAGSGEFDETASSPSQTKEILLSPSPGLNQLGYNTAYQWRVRVWDSGGLASDWAYGNNFTTPLHIYPTPDFTWSPQVPFTNQTVQ